MGKHGLAQHWIGKLSEHRQLQHHLQFAAIHPQPPQNPGSTGYRHPRSR
jgi:hypothetical protein